MNWQSTVFEARFSRCRKMLFFLACRLLGSSEQVHDVVENCKMTASRNPATFESEGAFRSRLVRILIDEALAIVRQRKGAITKVQEAVIRLPQRD
jgi:DNA-directed RNA polymerase specialized sigma24 family protein